MPKTAPKELKVTIAERPNPSDKTTRPGKGRQRSNQFWLEGSESRDSYYGMRPAASPKPHHDTQVPEVQLAAAVKKAYMTMKIPGELVAERGEAMALQDKVVGQQRLIAQRKARQNDLRLRMSLRRAENYEKEARLGTTFRAAPKVKKDEAGKPLMPRESTQPIKKKDWRYYRRGDANLWTDYYHVPLNRLEQVIPQVALEADEKAIKHVMECLDHEDKEARVVDMQRDARIERERQVFNRQLMTNMRKEEYVFKSANTKFRSRPSTATNGRMQKSGCDGFVPDGIIRTMEGGAKTRPQSAPMSRTATKKEASRQETFVRLSQPKQAVIKKEVAKRTGCAELKGMLLTDKALMEQLSELEKSKAKGRPPSGKSAKERAAKDSTAQRDDAAAKKTTTRPADAGFDADYIQNSRAQLAGFQKKIDQHPDRYEVNDLYVNPLSIYE